MPPFPTARRLSLVGFVFAMVNPLIPQEIAVLINVKTNSFSSFDVYGGSFKKRGFCLSSAFNNFSKFSCYWKIYMLLVFGELIFISRKSVYVCISE